MSPDSHGVVGFHGDQLVRRIRGRPFSALMGLGTGVSQAAEAESVSLEQKVEAAQISVMSRLIHGNTGHHDQQLTDFFWIVILPLVLCVGVVLLARRHLLP